MLDRPVAILLPPVRRAVEGAVAEIIGLQRAGDTDSLAIAHRHIAMLSLAVETLCPLISTQANALKALEANVLAQTRRLAALEAQLGALPAGGK